jgi:hypothetical protein
MRYPTGGVSTRGPQHLNCGRMQSERRVHAIRERCINAECVKRDAIFVSARIETIRRQRLRRVIGYRSATVARDDGAVARRAVRSIQYSDGE